VADVRSILTSVVACAVFGCGASPQVDTPQSTDSKPLVAFDPEINVCPVFEGMLVIPLDIPPNVPAQIIVKVTDPDGIDAALTYEWSAPSGNFSDPKSPITAYRCAELGPQALRVTAEDVVGCGRSTELNVSCVAE
jgi:hypothetical protein